MSDCAKKNEALAVEDYKVWKLFEVCSRRKKNKIYNI